MVPFTLIRHGIDKLLGHYNTLPSCKHDICYAINKIYQFMHTPTKDHWAVFKRILCYLQATTIYGLHITRDSFLSLNGFIDVDWAY